MGSARRPGRRLSGRTSEVHAPGPEAQRQLVADSHAQWPLRRQGGTRGLASRQGDRRVREARRRFDRRHRRGQRGLGPNDRRNRAGAREGLAIEPFGRGQCPRRRGRTGAAFESARHDDAASAPIAAKKARAPRRTATADRATAARRSPASPSAIRTSSIFPRPGSRSAISRATTRASRRGSCRTSSEGR